MYLKKIIFASTLMISAFVQADSRIQNIATRGFVGSADNVLIGGFVITGTEAKIIIVRARGSVLGDAGVIGALDDPTISLYSGNTVIDTNDNWESHTNSGLIPANLQPVDTREAIIVRTLEPGAYTAIVSGANGEEGIGLIEVFELQDTGETRLVNIATRGFSGTDDSVLIGGVVVIGDSSIDLVIRAKGPSLIDFNVAGALSNPTLTLFSGQVVIDSNDDWQEQFNSGKIPINLRPTADSEAALFTTVAPGAYTIIVAGVGGETGVALVEIFESMDTDSSGDFDADGLSNLIDLDDDEDGIVDIDDAFPFDSGESIDTDGDGIGNNRDDDDDGDFILDVVDANPLVPDVIFGQAYLGPIIGATVELFDISIPEAGPIFTTETANSQILEAAGNFRIPIALLSDEGLYVIRITGGQDIDANDDGVLDASPTEFLGSIRALGQGSDFKNASFQVNALTEVSYQSVVLMIESEYPSAAILTQADIVATRLIREDINNDGSINRIDALAFKSREDRASYSHGVDAFATLNQGLLVDTLSAADKVVLSDRLISSIDVTSITSVAVQSNLVYVAAQVDGLSIIDITEPGEPVVLGVLSSSEIGSNPSNKMVVSDGVAYLLTFAGLKIVDVSDSGNPMLIGSVDILGQLSGLDIFNGVAYIGGGTNGLHIVDLSDLTSPVLLGGFTTSASTGGVQVVDGIAFVGATDGLLMFDVSNPAIPTLLGSIAADGRLQSFLIEGDNLYLGDNTGLKIFNLINIVSPELVSSLETTERPILIARQDSRLFLKGRFTGYLEVIDITDAISPSIIGRIAVPDILSSILIAVDNRAYFSAGSLGLQVLNLAGIDSTNAIVAQVNTPGFAVDVSVSGGRALVADSEGGLQIMDVSDSTNASFVSAVATNEAVSGVAVVGNIAYVANDAVGFQTVDISVPASPKVLDTISSPPNDPTAVVVTDGVAYIAGSRSGLEIIDVSDPEDLNFLGAIDTFNRAVDIAVNGTLAYLVDISDSSMGLQIFDVSDPTNPTLRATFSTSDSPLAVTIYNSFAFIAVGQKGIQIVDVSDTFAPSLVASFDTPGRARGVAIANDIAYVADESFGLQIVDVSQPAHPALLGRFVTADDAVDVAVSEGFVYVADGKAGLTILRSITIPRAQLPFDLRE